MNISQRMPDRSSRVIVAVANTCVAAMSVQFVRRGILK
jgi:hypothetical protein